MDLQLIHGIAFGLGLATSSIIAGLFGLGELWSSGNSSISIRFICSAFSFLFMLIAVILYANIDDEEFISCFNGGFTMNAIGFVGLRWTKIAYLLGFAAGANTIGTAGECYGY